MGKGHSKGWKKEETRKTNMPSPRNTPNLSTPSKRKKLNLGNSLNLSALIVGVFLMIVVPPLAFKLLGLAFVCWGSVRLLWDSYWTYKWPRRRKVVIAIFTLGIVSTISIPQFIAQWRTEHRKPSQPQITVPAIQEPVVDVDPQTVLENPDGSFSLRMVNRGPDIDHIAIQLEYFVARRNQGNITIYRVFRYIEDPRMTTPPLRTNQYKLLMIYFATSELPVSALRSLQASELPVLVYRRVSEKYPALLGVRVTATFKMYSDGRDFKKVWPYEAEPQSGADKFTLLYGPSIPEYNSVPPEIRDKFLIFSEVIPFMNSDQHWVDPVIRVSFTRDGKKIAEVR